MVFHTPPAAVATYQTALSVGSTAISAMRPSVRAGPMDLSLKPPTMPESPPLSARGADAADGVAPGFDAGEGFLARAWPRARPGTASKSASRGRMIPEGRR